MGENEKKELNERVGSIVSKLNDLSEKDIAVIYGMCFGMTLNKNPQHKTA